MVHYSVERNLSSTSVDENKSFFSATSVLSNTTADCATSNNPKSLKFDKDTSADSETPNKVLRKHSNKKLHSDVLKGKGKALTPKNKSKTCIKKKEKEMEKPNENAQSETKTTVEKEKSETKTENIENRGKTTDPAFETCAEGPDRNNDKVIQKPRANSPTKRTSEIPKLKSISKVGIKSPPTVGTGSRLPIKTTRKETAENKQNDTSSEGSKTKSEVLKLVKPLKVKKEAREEDKIKDAIKINFNTLVPYYEKELKKVADVWVNTIFCSLTLRSNLVQFLFQAFPLIKKSQFKTENEKLHYSIIQAKNYTKAEAIRLVNLVRSLIESREKAKEEYMVFLGNKEIAQSFNNDWKELTQQIAKLEEDTRQLRAGTPEILKKKDEIQAAANEKIQKIESNLSKKDEQIQKLVNQLNALKQRELSYKGNVSLKIQDYKEIKADVISLIALQKELEELKAKYTGQNKIHEKKIKTLEDMLEDKKKILEREKQTKKQLQAYLGQLQAQQKRLKMTIGKDQLEFVMGQSQERDLKREQLWVMAIKLVLKGFMIQMKKLERERNKMLLELHSNDSENLHALAVSIIQKDHFMKSIKNQMRAFHHASPCQKTNNAESTLVENVLN